MRELITLTDVKKVLETAKTIAVLGFHNDVSRPAYYVPAYLHARGYRILGVNPILAAQGVEAFGEPVRASLAELREPVDVVDVFRRAEVLPSHLDDILAMNPRPGTVWLQLGIQNGDVTQALIQAGIDVVQDRCMLADHQRLAAMR